MLMPLQRPFDVFSGRIPTVQGYIVVDSRNTIIRGGNKPEVVFPRGFPRVQRVSWVDSDGLR